VVFALPAFLWQVRLEIYDALKVTTARSTRRHPLAIEIDASKKKNGKRYATIVDAGL
jgi:hypothetical protein